MLDRCYFDLELRNIIKNQANMKLKYDPSDNQGFWDSINQIPGYPSQEDIRLRQIIIESGAIYQLPQIIASINSLKQFRSILVVMDTTIMRRGSEELKQAILNILANTGLQIYPLIIKPDQTGIVHTEMTHISHVKSFIQPDMIIISVGSGVITDITKHACYLYEQETNATINWIAYQTANSVSAFTSNMAPILIDGVKRTLDSRFADILICDLETLRDAPRDMTIAGVGDLLAGGISIGDWYLANQLGMDDTYNEFPQTLLGPICQLLEKCSAEINALTLSGMATLAKLISLNGLAISLTHASTPYSGFEHVVSHMLDLENEMAGLPTLLHGAQVGLTTIIGAEIYQYVLNSFSPTQININECFPSVDKSKAMLMDVFDKIDLSGKAGLECWHDYQQKLEKWHQNRQIIELFLSNWETIKQQLATLVSSPQSIRGILSAVHGPKTIADFSPSLTEQQLKFAFMNAPLMRKRFTIGDFLIFFKIDRESLWDNILQTI